MNRVKLTCFADEISHDLDEQLDVLEAEGVRHIELRNVWGKNVLDLSAEELKRIHRTLDERGFGLSSIGSPIGKYPLAEEFSPQLDRFQKAIDAALSLGTSYIRVFSYHPPEGAALDDCRDETLRRMEQLTAIAERNKVVLVLENDSNLYGTHHERCLEILDHCSSPFLRLAFDPGNFVMAGVRPMDDAYPLLKDYIEYIHIKDAVPGQFVPAGIGQGQIPELLAALKARGFGGFLSVEPHLGRYLPHASNPKRVVTAVRALKQLLEQSGLAYE